MKKIIKKFVSEELIEHCLNIVVFISIQIFRIKHGSLIIRKDTTDISVYTSIFILNEFKIKNTEFSPKFIIDAGAYTGLSSLYFSLNYPKSEIVALEPETSNFEVLSKNSSNKKNGSNNDIFAESLVNLDITKMFAIIQEKIHKERYVRNAKKILSSILN